jgi:glycerate 2-kinase
VAPPDGWSNPHDWVESMDTRILRRHAETIFRAGLEGVDAGAAVARWVQLRGANLLAGGESFALDAFERIRVVGMGKASAAMAGPLEKILGDRIDDGVIVVKDGHARPLLRIRVREAGHPVPDRRGVLAAEEMIRLVEGGGPRDLIFCLVSGGGSALSPAPVRGITLEEMQEITRLLLGSGATIHELNTVRKHISRLKGGLLARLAHPATVISLILSDVVGDNLDTIASGPTVPDGGTFPDCLSILDRRGIRSLAPPGILTVLEAGARGETPETPKAGDPVFDSVRNLIVGNNRMAVEAAAAKARELGYETRLPPGYEEGEARDVARAHVALARKVQERSRSGSRATCIITGGETTVTVRGTGTGGRNQELALAAALEMEGNSGIVVLSAGTDGTDGPTEAAGAVADGRSVERGRKAGMDAGEYLRQNDSYHFFRPLGDLLVTGPTFTNVMDLRIVLVAPPS